MTVIIFHSTPETESIDRPWTIMREPPPRSVCEVDAAPTPLPLWLSALVALVISLGLWAGIWVAVRGLL